MPRLLRSRGLALALFASATAFSLALNARRRQADRALAARLRRADQGMPELAATARVSVLVAAWNEARGLERHLASVRRLPYPDLQYILVAGGTDGTLECAQRLAWPGCTLLEQAPGEGKQRALRRALAHAAGDVIMLTDADCVLDARSFARLLAPIVSGQEEVVTGDSLPLREQRFMGGVVAFRWAADEYAFAHMPEHVGGILGGNCALTREALRQAGDLQEDVASGTDYHLAKSLRAAGIAIRHEPGAVVETAYPTSMRMYVRKQRRWLRNMVLHGLRFGATREAATSLLTSSIGVGMLLAPLAALAFGPGVLALWAAAVVHSATAKVRYLAFTADRFAPNGPRLSMRSALEALQMTFVEFYAWAQPLLDYALPSRRSAW
jgi:hypothetical protein